MTQKGELQSDLQVDMFGKKLALEITCKMSQIVTKKMTSMVIDKAFPLRTSSEFPNLYFELGNKVNGF